MSDHTVEIEGCLFSMTELQTLHEMTQHDGWPLFCKMMRQTQTSDVDSILNNNAPTTAEDLHVAQGRYNCLHALLNFKTRVETGIEEIKEQMPVKK